NNNTYCHDSELTWFDWNLVDQNSEMLTFVQGLIAFRKAHQALRNRWHLTGRDTLGTGYPDISWHGRQAWYPDWSAESRSVAFMLCGKHARGGQQPDDYIYVAFNSDWQTHGFELPQLPDGRQWHVAVNTGAVGSSGIWQLGEEPRLEEQSHILLADRSSVVLVGH
ncbi:MAG: glycogen debranching enzyme, partial [Deinococcota bacterium]